jgi:hypothetical protein
MSKVFLIVQEVYVYVSCPVTAFAMFYLVASHITLAMSSLSTVKGLICGTPEMESELIIAKSSLPVRNLLFQLLVFLE